MKKLVMVFLTGITMLAITACGGKETTAVEDSLSAFESTEVSSEAESTDNSEDDIHYADLLPLTEDYFKNGEVTIIDQDGGKAYTFRITNYQDGEYESYVEACKSGNFPDVSYEGENEGGKMFYAYSSDGQYYLQVMLGNQIEAIDITCKMSTKDNSDSDQEMTDEVIETEESSSYESENTEIDPDFKAAMDSYEAFFDEYCEFMKKYNNSDDTISMMADYASYMAQYADTMEKMEAIDEDDLSDAEVMYYAEVSTRISQKLLEAAQ